MPVYMLHFACSLPKGETSLEHWTADSCALSTNLIQAEQLSRHIIRQHHYVDKELIAFSQVNEEKLASLSELESTLYLKAQVSTEKCAVLFTEWKE